MSRKRAPGEKDPPGYTKAKMICYFIENEEVEEPTVRDFLREEANVRDSKGQKEHLKDLKDMGILEKEERVGKANIWRLPRDEEVFQKIWREFPPSRVCAMNAPWLFKKFCEIYAGGQKGERSF